MVIMSKKRGLSIEEKKQKLLELFTEKKDVFLLKELEKIAPKEKGIISQSVKEVLKSLVDDNLVDSDKIGSSTYFWTFGTKTYTTKMQAIDELNSKIEQMAQKSSLLDNQLKSYATNESESALKEAAFEELNRRVAQRDELKARLETLKNSDPQVFQQMKCDIDASKDAIIRWTDNVFAIKSWCKRKFSLEENDFNKQFGVPEEFDYPEFNDEIK